MGRVKQTLDLTIRKDLPILKSSSGQDRRERGERIPGAFAYKKILTELKLSYYIGNFR